MSWSFLYISNSSFSHVYPVSYIFNVCTRLCQCCFHPQFIDFKTTAPILILFWFLFTNSFLSSWFIKSRGSAEWFWSLNLFWGIGLVKLPYTHCPLSTKLQAQLLRLCPSLPVLVAVALNISPNVNPFIKLWLCIKILFALECWKLLVYLEMGSQSSNVTWTS